MARKLRVQYPGAIYHVMNRGDRREAIFLDDDDRRLFMKTLDEACKKTDWEIHAWCPAGREQFAGQIEARRRAEAAGDYELKGWCLGSEKFQQELLAQVGELA